MSAVMWSDFITCKNLIKQQLIIALIIALAVSLPTGTVTVVCPTVAVAMTMSAAVSVVALDERNGWEGFRSCLPLSRRDIIWGRMGFIALVALASIVLGLLLSVIISNVIQVIGPTAGIDPLSYRIDLLTLLFTSCVTALTLAFATGTTMPLIARFGMSSAMRFISLIWVAFFLIVFIGIDRSPLGPMLMTGLDALMVQAPWLACMALLIGAAAIFIAGGALAAKMYQGREL